MNLRTASLVCAAATLARRRHRGLGPPGRAGAPRPRRATTRSSTPSTTSRAARPGPGPRPLDLDFETHHPQAMEVVGDRIYLSSVEIIEPTVRYPEPVRRLRPDAGQGRGPPRSSSTARASC